MKKLNRDMKRLSKRTEKAFKSASNVVVDVFTTPPPQTIKKIRKRNKKTREEICTSIERLNQEMVEFSNNLCIRIVESLNKDLATGKPLRPFYDDVENVPLTHAYIVQQETLKKEDNSWVSESPSESIYI